ncbi:hypothetical protein ABTY04_13015, partial [Streptomyces sp. NPDC097981]
MLGNGHVRFGERLGETGPEGSRYRAPSRLSITAADRTWVAAHHPGRAMLQRVDPRFGLTPADFAALDAWLRP